MTTNPGKDMERGTLLILEEMWTSADTVEIIIDIFSKI